jgi:hypothetical protein
MALKKDYDYSFEMVAHLPWGETVNQQKTQVMRDAYIKVSRVEGDKNQLSATVLISSEGKYAAKIYSFVPSMDNENFIKQTYTHLKTLPDFEGATDC